MNFVAIDACCPVLVCMVLFDVSYVVAAYFIHPPPPPPPPVPLDFLLSIKAFQQTDVKCVYVTMCVCVWGGGGGGEEERLLYISEVHEIKQAEVNRKCSCSSSTGYIVHVIKETQEFAEISFT